ncbi:hypothetical protein [Nocardiopsis dassonvillei]|uniref:hypothetical protein n=1 Tax=Nocardiopsis dassonvillei TaxID=2014 RepID=UPI000B9D5672|nr:hypothetical protein [Nocardiopsis dassonvillei]ASU61031.1 hypothetical protein CGQ36_27270 [Nocardiopsis dassonvillei]
MSGVHGLTSAAGARSAVLPAPVRRALLLAALVCGLVVTAWLTASDPVRAQEEGATGTLVHQAASVAASVRAPAAQAVAERPEAERAAHGHEGSGRNGSGQAGAARTDAGGPDSGNRPDAGTSVPMTARINDPLVGAVSAVGENTTRMVLDGSAGVSRGDVPETPGVARQIRDTVHGVTEPVEEYLDEDDASGTEPRTQDPSATPADTDERTGTESGAAVPPAPAEVVTHFVPAVTGATAGAVRAHADPAAENAPARLVSDPVATPSGLNGSASGSAQGAPIGVPAVAGYLTTTGAPAPAPGQLQAARHVLLAVPAESADEPTFSPD